MKKIPITGWCGKYLYWKCNLWQHIKKVTSSIAQYKLTTTALFNLSLIDLHLYNLQLIPHINCFNLASSQKSLRYSSQKVIDFSPPLRRPESSAPHNSRCHNKQHLLPNPRQKGARTHTHRRLKNLASQRSSRRNLRIPQHRNVLALYAGRESLRKFHKTHRHTGESGSESLASAPWTRGAIFGYFHSRV